MVTIDFSFRELEIFCKVVDMGSFSKAAEAVFLVQASVSERIASPSCQAMLNYLLASAVEKKK